MTTARKPHPVASLPFVADRAPNSRSNLRRCFWNVQPTGNYNEDCHTGYGFAIEYLRYRQEREESTPLLPSIVHDMPKGREREPSHYGIEVGFLLLMDCAASLPHAEALMACWKRAARERDWGALVNQRPDGSVVIEQPDGTRAVYRREGDAK
jgi:hypothetical protein